MKRVREREAEGERERERKNGAKQILWQENSSSLVNLVSMTMSSQMRTGEQPSLTPARMYLYLGKHREKERHSERDRDELVNSCLLLVPCYSNAEGRMRARERRLDSSVSILL